MVPDYFVVEWHSFLLSYNINTKKSYKTFVTKFEFLLDIYAPLKNNYKNKLKFKDKPWTNPGLQNSTSIKNHFLSKFIKFKNPCKKKESPHKTQATQIFYQHY